MAEEEDDKQYEPSQKKLDDARKKGDLPRSQDLTGAIAYGTILLTFIAIGPWVATQIGSLGVLPLLQDRAWLGDTGLPQLPD